MSQALEFLNGVGKPFLKESFRKALLRYLEDHIETGSFLRACLENDFQKALLRADYTQHINDLKYVAIAISTFPAEAWGSQEKVVAWIAAGKGAG